MTLEEDYTEKRQALQDCAYKTNQLALEAYTEAQKGSDREWEEATRILFSIMEDLCGSINKLRDGITNTLLISRDCKTLETYLKIGEFIDEQRSVIRGMMREIRFRLSGDLFISLIKERNGELAALFYESVARFHDLYVVALFTLLDGSLYWELASKCRPVEEEVSHD